jgi:hypothetical protein
MKRKDWLDVDMEGMRKVLERRGKQLAIYELVQNGWDENVTKVEVTLARPENGRSELVVDDDSPEGFRDLTDSYTGTRGCRDVRKVVPSLKMSSFVLWARLRCHRVAVPVR